MIEEITVWNQSLVNGPGRMQMHELVRIELTPLGIQADRNVEERDDGKQHRTHYESMVLYAALTNQIADLPGRTATSEKGTIMALVSI